MDARKLLLCTLLLSLASFSSADHGFFENIVLSSTIQPYQFVILAVSVAVVFLVFYITREGLFGGHSPLHGLTWRLIVSFIILGLIVSTVTTYIFYLIANQELEHEVSEHLETAAHLRAEHVSDFIDKDIERLNLVASRTKLRTTLSSFNLEASEEERDVMRGILLDALSSVDDFESISILDFDGRVIVSTNQKSEGNLSLHRSVFLESRNESSFFILKDRYDNASIYLSGPLMLDGELLGVMFIKSNLSHLYEILSNPIGLGDSGETYIIDENGRLLTPLKFIDAGILDYAVNSDNAHECLEDLNEYLSGDEVEYHEENPISSLDYRNVLTLGAHSYVPNVRWCLLAEVDESEAIAPQRNLLLVTSILIALVVILSFLVLGYFISRKIVGPITELRLATEQVEKGNYKARVDIKTGDELEKLGESFNKTTEALGNLDSQRKQLDHAKTEFLSITSHELRSPMTPMQAQLQMLSEGYYGKLTKKQKDSLEIILRNTKHLDHIIQDFLEISRIEAARLKFHFTKTDLKKELNALVEEMRNFLPEKKIKIDFRMEELPEFEVDPERVGQVLRNLLNNAKKFSPENTTISVDVRLQENDVLFTVKDRGIGIKPEDQARMFEPFFQAEQTMYRKYGGTGLGLAICKGIVESQGGRIWLYSEPGKGTTFYFTVPLIPVSDMKPIKLLFSQTENIKNGVKALFIENLGPMGETEFYSSTRDNELTKESIIEYIFLLYKSKVITAAQRDKFKDEVVLLFKKIESGYVNPKEVDKK